MKSPPEYSETPVTTGPSWTMRVDEIVGIKYRHPGTGRTWSGEAGVGRHGTTKYLPKRGSKLCHGIGGPVTGSLQDVSPRPARSSM